MTHSRTRLTCVDTAATVVLRLQFTHSKGDKAASRQALKESSSKALKAKAKFDPKNYTSVLVRKRE